MRQFTVICIPFFFSNQDKSTGDIPAAGIADVQLQLYKKNRDHHSALHNHGASLPDVKICGNGSTPNGFPNEVCLDKQTTDTFHIMIIFNNHQFINMWTIAVVVFYSAFCVA